MRTDTVEVYTYDELSEQAKEKVLARFSDINVECGDYAEYLTDEFLEKLNAAGIEAKKVYWSAVRGREWFAHLDGVLIDAPKLLSCVIGQSQTQSGESEFGDFRVSMENNRGRSSTLEVSYDGYGEDEEMEKLAPVYEEKLQAWLDERIEEFLRAVEKEWEYATGREAIEETIKANEWEFLASGEGWR